MSGEWLRVSEIHSSFYQSSLVPTKQIFSFSYLTRRVSLVTRRDLTHKKKAASTDWMRLLMKARIGFEYRWDLIMKKFACSLKAQSCRLLSHHWVLFHNVRDSLAEKVRYANIHTMRNSVPSLFGYESRSCGWKKKWKISEIENFFFLNFQQTKKCLQTMKKVKKKFSISFSRIFSVCVEFIFRFSSSLWMIQHELMRFQFNSTDEPDEPHIEIEAWRRRENRSRNPNEIIRIN